MRWFRRPTPQFMTLNPPAPEPAQRDRIPADMWNKCKSCETVLLSKDFVLGNRVCPNCGHHDRLPARERIELLADAGTFAEFDAHLQAADPLGFEDKRKYADYIASTRKKTGRNDAVITGHARIGGVQVSLAVMDFAFMGGSMGSVVGEKVTRAMEASLRERIPCVTVVSTGGARMQEGILSLMQMAKTSLLCHQLDLARIPFVVILADPSTAGVMASFASLGDIIIAEPKAYIGFAGKRVIEQTIKQQLPPTFQTAEFQRDKGFVDLVVDRRELKETLVRVLKHLLRTDEPTPDQATQIADAESQRAAANAEPIPVAEAETPANGGKRRAPAAKR